MIDSIVREGHKIQIGHCLQHLQIYRKHTVDCV